MDGEAEAMKKQNSGVAGVQVLQKAKTSDWAAFLVEIDC
jgi:hypothetical protein